VVMGAFKTRLTCMTAPPQPSKQELAAAEAQTMTDIKWTAASAVVLYFCKDDIGLHINRWTLTVYSTSSRRIRLEALLSSDCSRNYESLLDIESAGHEQVYA
jgi:hypothetical protein